MYVSSDPRARLAAATAERKPAAASYAAADYARLYEMEPQEVTSEYRSWYIRGRNFVVVYSEAQPGAVLSRAGQGDEYAVIAPDPSSPIEITSGSQRASIPGESIAFVPPGDSSIVLPDGGRVARMFTARSGDLISRSCNAGHTDPNVPALETWPVPADGYRVRSYSLNVPVEPGRFGRIFRCTTLMINVLDPQLGPRDMTKLSPHSHDDFQQASLALQGSFLHHLRWPWTPDRTVWRDDEHELCGSPSVAIIPARVIHTSEARDAGINQLVDIFCPPRLDFSSQPGWVLNADDYPMPDGERPSQR